MSHPEELPPHQPSLTERVAERALAAPRWAVMTAAAVVIAVALWLVPDWVPPSVLALVGLRAWWSADQLKVPPPAEGLLINRRSAERLSALLTFAGVGLAVTAGLQALEALVAWLGWSS